MLVGHKEFTFGQKESRNGEGLFLLTLKPLKKKWHNLWLAEWRDKDALTTTTTTIHYPVLLVLLPSSPSQLI